MVCDHSSQVNSWLFFGKQLYIFWVNSFTFSGLTASFLDSYIFALLRQLSFQGQPKVIGDNSCHLL
jgi:hypothetical protein